MIFYNTIRRTIIFATLAALLCVLPASRAQAEVVDKVVAVVNSSIITLSELNAAMAVALGGLKGQAPLASNDTVETRSLVLDGLIEKILIKQTAERAGIKISEREIDNAVDDVKAENNMTQDQLLLALSHGGITYAQYREQIADDILQIRFMDRMFRSKINIKPEDIENFYQRNLKVFYGPPTMRIRILFLSNENLEMQALRLQAVLNGLKTGADFSELATQYSEGPAVDKGGDLGYLKSGEIAPFIEKAAKKLRIGQVSSRLDTEEGIYFIHLVGKKPGAPAPLDQVKQVIANNMYQQILIERYNFWLEGMKRIAFVDVRL